jgi:uncharacterized protein YcbK (DUF882 family)
MAKLTKNFSEDELACKCGESHAFEMCQEFLGKLQKTRDLYGKKMTVTSGFRCAAWNEKQGGVASSKHLKGMAADILVKTDRDRGELIMAAINAGFRRIGIAKSFVHLDSAESDRVTVWLYF